MIESASRSHFRCAVRTAAFSRSELIQFASRSFFRGAVLHRSFFEASSC